MMGFADEQAARMGTWQTMKKGGKVCRRHRGDAGGGVQRVGSRPEDRPNRSSHATKPIPQDKIRAISARRWRRLQGCVYTTYKDDIKGGTAEEIKELPLSCGAGPRQTTSN